MLVGLPVIGNAILIALAYSSFRLVDTACAGCIRLVPSTQGQGASRPTST